ncbi:MAG: acyl-CoA thioesterase [Stellaceae bacterium]
MVTVKRLIRVEWGDCDPAEIVFYPNYFAWFDASTTHLFASVGLLPGRFFAEFGVKGFPLLEASAKFYVASGFGDEIEAESGVVEWGNKTFRVTHRFRRGGELLLEGSETRIFVVADSASGRLKSVPVPDEVKRRLGG